MKGKKIFAMLLVAVVCLSVISGCQNQNSSVTSPSPKVEEPKTAEVRYPVQTTGNNKLNYWIPIQPPAAKYLQSYNEHEIYTQISKNTGIDVNFIHPAVGQEKEQLNLLIASGDLPDIIAIKGLYSGGPSAGIDDGIFRDLTEDVPKYAPDYYKAITKDELVYCMSTDEEGRIANFNIIKQSAPAFRRIEIREDVMEQIGVKENPVTLDDYANLFEKMSKAGITPFAPVQNGREVQFMWPFDITQGFFIGTDGKVKFGESEAKYKEYLTLMNEWYNSGYISKDFMGKIDRAALFGSKQVGLSIEPIDLVYSRAKLGGYEIRCINYPRIEAGQQIHFEPNYWIPVPADWQTVVTQKSKNPELAIQYLNYFFTQEGADLCNWGIKDLSYTVDASGKKKFTDRMLKNPDIALSDVQTMLKIHLVAKYAEPDVVCNPNVISDQKSLELRMMYSDDKTVDGKCVLPILQMNPKVSSEISSIMKNVNTYVDEMTLKFITGVVPISEFDKYISQLKAMNVDRAIELYQQSYDKFTAKKLPQK